MSKHKNRTHALASTCYEMRQERLRPGAPLMPVFENRVRDLMTPEHLPEVVQGEVLPADNTLVKDTLENPDTTAVDASLERTALLQRADALEMGIDAAESICARNSLEKMLVHQMAACHVNAMKLLSLITDREALGRSCSPSPELLMVKQINLAARLMDVYQKGMDTLTRTRTAGRQTITVKQVHVTGGQNVIADTVSTGGRKRGSHRKNDDTP